MAGLKKEKGQSTIEFLVSFTLVIYFLFFFLKLAYVYTTGFLVHYAVYQSSRVYFSYDSSSNDPNDVIQSGEEIARAVFQRFSLESFVPSFNADNLFFNSPYEVSPPYHGAIFEYQDDLRFSTSFGESEVLNLTSESLLGKEPSTIRCIQRITDVFQEQGAIGSMKHVVLADNGC